MLRARASVVVALALVLGAGCPRRTETPPAVAEGASCPTFRDPEVIGRSPSVLREISGVVASRRQPGVLWVHNDSGAGPEIHALGLDGALLADGEVVGAQAVDWEDIALGPGPEPGRDYLYIADIGDNQRRRSSVVIYRIPEPEVGSGAGLRLRSEPAVATTLRYDRGAENAEALLVDPLDGALYVISKRVGAAALYAVDGDALVRQAAVDAGSGALVTAADFSRDGRWIALRTYNAAYLWPRPAGRSIAEALGEAPCVIKAAREGQGEAIGFTADDAALITISEAKEGDDGVPIYRLAFQSGGPDKT
ncbi:MAG: hypothetical protein R3B09_15805 [Nannocystaceae bacterium]